MEEVKKLTKKKEQGSIWVFEDGKGKCSAHREGEVANSGNEKFNGNYSDTILILFFWYKKDIIPYFLIDLNTFSVKIRKLAPKSNVVPNI